MIDVVVKNQADVFFLSIICGVNLFLVYDIIRGFRRAVSHNNVAIAIEDFIYCMFYSCIIIALIYSYNEGQLRGYVVLGIAIGDILYYLILSRLIVRIFEFVFLRIRYVFRFAFILFLKPLKFLLKRQ